MASIRDVARQAGVSPATVSRAFTNPSLINEQTQRRVLEAALLLDYRPPRLREARRHPVFAGARNAPLSSVQDAIGFQFFSATSSPGDTLGHNTFYAPVLAGAQVEASALGLHLLVHTTDRHRFSLDLPRMIQERVIGGLLLVGVVEPAVIETCAAHVRPIVLVDNRHDQGDSESVMSDGFGGAYEATRYLFELGHRKLGFFTEDPEAPSFQDRLRGFVCAHFEAGIPVNPDWVVGHSSDEEIRCAQVAELLRQSERPTALLAANDYHALLVLRVCRSLSLRIPEDLSLIGFDDTEMTTHSDPPITTLRVNKEYMGRLAVRRLYERMRRAETGEPEVVPVCHQIPVTLLRRESCRAINNF